MKTYKEPKRVLHVFGKLDTGGAERRVLDIYREIDKNKIQFDFMVHSDDESIFDNEIRELGGNIYRINKFNGLNYFKYKRAWRYFLKEHDEIDIIHGHQTSTGFIYLKIAKKQGIQMRISHARNSNTDNYLKYFLTRISKYYSTTCLAVSNLAAISEFGKYMTDRKHVSVIPNGIDAKKYVFDEEKRLRFRQELRIEDKFVIGHIGRFREQKNHKFLIDVFSEYKKMNKNSVLLLIGSGPLEQEIKGYVENKGLDNSVKFMGLREDIPDILQYLDVLLLPSLYEGMPGVILESQAAGLPSIISNTITEDVKITEYVHFLPIDSGTNLWCNKLNEIKETSTRRNTFYDIKRKNFDIEEVTQTYEKLYLDFFK